MSCFMDLCRLCAGKIDSLLSFNIHAHEHAVLLKKIVICLPIQVSEGDNYPNYICVDCAFKLDSMYEFRERCILTTQLFDEMMSDEVRSALELPSSVSHEHLDLSVQHSSDDKSIVVDLPALDFETDTPYLMEQNDQADENQLLADMTNDIIPLGDLKMEDNKLSVPSPVLSEVVIQTEDLQDQRLSIGEENKKKRKCTECGVVCSSKYRLSQHMQKHRPEKPFTCSYLNCSKSFRSKIGLAQHEAGHSGKFNLSCETCGKGFQCKSYLKVHQRVHSIEKNFSCQQCPQSFKSKQSLADHINRHLGVKPFLCDICGRGFITKGLCKSHQKTHTGQDNRKFPCHVCRKRFVSKSYLRIHFNIHSGIKPFICEVCGKSFVTMVDLKVHNTLHTGEKSYVCETCGKAFARRDALRCHRRSHTGERPYKCDHCGQSFSQFSPMAVHKRLHTGERPYPCEDCTKAFVSRSTLNAHRKKHHDVESQSQSSAGKVPSVETAGQ